MLPATKNRNHRLHALCPYFAMFPPSFAKDAILATTEPGDLVLDPFSGRGTTLLEALLNGRTAVATDINPVAAAVSFAKAHPPELAKLLHRITAHEEAFSRADMGSLKAEANTLPEFFRHAFHPDTLAQMLFLRRQLLHTRAHIDGFIAALCLGHLHGESNKSPNFFSNQMAHPIAMKPAYAIRYWTEHEMVPPYRDVFSILKVKANFRLAEGVPETRASVRRGDARDAAKLFPDFQGQVAAIVTSPPYLDVTRFEEDQWLRLWFLGGKPHPTYGEISTDDRHSNAPAYFQFLGEVWAGVAPLLKDGATITCRISAKKITVGELSRQLLEPVKSVRPAARQTMFEESGLRKRQTDVFRPGSEGCINEYDYRFALA